MTNEAIVDRLAIALQDAVASHGRAQLRGAKVRVPSTLSADAWEEALVERLATVGIECVELDIEVGKGDPALLSTRFEPGWS
jgi:hypothetical protein